MTDAASCEVPSASPLDGGRRTQGRGIVRPLERGDLEEVADVFLRVFRRMDDPVRRRAALPGLVAYLDALYLGAPSYDAATGSLVHRTAAGDLGGFLGSIPTAFRLGDRRLRASAMGAFMVADPYRHTEAALSLARHHLANGLDIHFTDTANRITLEISRSMHAELLPLHSLEWVLPLRPASLLLERAARQWPRWPFGLAGPLARRFDRPIRRMLQGPERPRHESGVVVADMDREAFLAAAPGAVADRRLRPEWRRDDLSWTLDQAALRSANGPLRLRIARDETGHVVGFWAVWAKAGGVAAVLQIFPATGRTRATLAALIADTEALGCLAVRGTTDPGFMDALYAVPGLLFHHKGATGLKSCDPEVTEAARVGDVALGGFAGESWTRLVSDRF